ncbi:MAG: hypothetical protein ACHQAY_06735 [Hyphomicrobiales bacterium]
MADIDRKAAATAGKGKAPAASNWEAALIALPFALFAAIAAVPLSRWNSHVMLGYNEGWNAYYALAAASGGELYPAPDAFIGNNYPPLSFFTAGLLGRLIGGDYVVAGRLLALASLPIVAGNLFAIGRWVGADRAAAALGSGVFLVLFATLTPDYIGQDDPQMFGHALVTSGAVVFLRGRASLARLAVAAALTIAGGLVKHNLVALPLALCCWAAFHDRRRLALFAAAGAGIGVTALGLLHVLWGEAVFDAVLRSPRVTDWHRMLVFTRFALVGKMLVPLVVLTGAACLLRARRPESHLLALYAFLAALAGFPLLSGAGVNFNVLADFCMGLSLGAALAVSVAGESGVARRRLTMLVVAAVLSLQANAFFRMRPDYYDRPSREVDETRALVDVLAKADGPVACENLVFCFWAGRPQEMDFFNYGQKLFTGFVTDTEFRRRLSEHRYRYLVMDVVKTNSRLWPPRLPRDTIAWLQANYAPVGRYGDNILLAPTGAGARTP